MSHAGSPKVVQHVVQYTPMSCCLGKRVQTDSTGLRTQAYTHPWPAVVVMSLGSCQQRAIHQLPPHHNPIAGSTPLAINYALATCLIRHMAPYTYLRLSRRPSHRREKPRARRDSQIGQAIDSTAVARLRKGSLSSALQGRYDILRLKLFEPPPSESRPASDMNSRKLYAL